jgi:hypothetical protein
VRVFLTRARRSRRLATGLLAVLVLAGALSTSASTAQRRFALGFARSSEWKYDGQFIFCRVAYSEGRYGEGGGWSVDYPQADSNFPWRMRQLTTVPVSMNTREQPNHVVVTLDDPNLFKCPFIMMTEVGNIYLSAEHAENLRMYLEKGGFLWADDFWGSYAWDVWEYEMAKVFPGKIFNDVPLNHPLFHMVLPTQPTQIPSLGRWYDLGFGTSERGADSRDVHVRSLMDDDGRIMVLATHNTDYGDAFEREGQDRAYFTTFAGKAYSFGINVIVYAMTH